MSAEIAATATGDGTTLVSAEVYEGSAYQPVPILADLAAGDRVVATSGGTSMTLDKTQMVNGFEFSALFPTGKEGETFKVDLQRTLDDGAPNSTATLPAPFTLDPVPSSASRSDGLGLTWSPSGTSDQMEWEIEGDCIQDTLALIHGDPGSYTIPSGMFLQPPYATESTCTVTVTLRRYRAGTLDPAYGQGGNIYGVQARTATFTSTH
jgi:hypothetical protein